MRAELEKRGLSHQVSVDSAGTEAWHTGKAPDPRSQAHAKKRGIDISGCRARQVASEDFFSFDYVLAMDKSNLRALKQRKPVGAKARLDLLLSFGNLPGSQEVPDPYHGEQDGFELVLNLIEVSVADLVDHIAHTDLRLPPCP